MVKHVLSAPRRVERDPDHHSPRSSASLFSRPLRCSQNVQHVQGAGHMLSAEHRNAGTALRVAVPLTP